MLRGAPLPIDDKLPVLTAALRQHGAAVLIAPPGAGKTTRVPLVLADEPWAADKKIIVLEPRRLAARAAARRMASLLGESVGETVGYRIRFGSEVSARTRIEIVTEGVFTRLILNDPALDNVAAVLFDEFHERSLDADLGLALAREVQQGLREDLKLLVMSATLDGVRVGQLLGDAQVIESAGRAFPVDVRYLGREPAVPIEQQVVDAVARAIRLETGSLLVFLPGAAEIQRTERLLRERINDGSIDIVPLYGALPADVQDRAIAPAVAGRRKIVLATSIAETSLTIEGVRIVVDCGLARVARYEPDVGLTRLETVRVSRASADQRCGRAGRSEQGICFRLWDEPQTASLAKANRPEILAADLGGFALDLAHWGVADPSSLPFLDPPPAPALKEAKTLLAELGALDANGRITEFGKQLRRIPLPPRLAAMLFRAVLVEEADLAAELCMLLSERGLGGSEIDLTERLDDFRRDRSPRARAARATAKRWAKTATAAAAKADRSAQAERDSRLSAGALVALAYPDRIARNRGAGGAFLLANGRGANLDVASGLSRARFLAVAEISGIAAQSRIMAAAPITLDEIEMLFADQIEIREEISFDQASAGLRAQRQRRLGAIILAEQSRKIAADADSAPFLANSLVIAHLPWTKSLRQWRDRVGFLRRAEGGEWPDLSDAALAASATAWLAPVLIGKTGLGELNSEEFAAALHGLLTGHLRHRLEGEAPTHYVTPSGSSVPIDYQSEPGPKIAVRVQELFGLDRHPAVGRGRVPLVIELLSPAQRPVQVTRDLPGFWRGSYSAVKAELKGRYPRHPWPDDPLSAAPTARAKRRAQ
jgi:ATP-dependent RNA helicase HrpB